MSCLHANIHHCVFVSFIMYPVSYLSMCLCIMSLYILVSCLFAYECVKLYANEHHVHACTCVTGCVPEYQALCSWVLSLLARTCVSSLRVCFYIAVFLHETRCTNISRWDRKGEPIQHSLWRFTELVHKLTDWDQRNNQCSHFSGLACYTWRQETI